MDEVLADEPGDALGPVAAVSRRRLRLVGLDAEVRLGLVDAAAAASLNELSPRPVTSKSRPTILPAPSASAVATARPCPHRAGTRPWLPPRWCRRRLQPWSRHRPPSCPHRPLSSPHRLQSCRRHRRRHRCRRLPATSARLAASAAAPMRLRRKRMPSPFVVEYVLRHATRPGPPGARMVSPRRHGDHVRRSVRRRETAIAAAATPNSSPLWCSPPFSSACSSRSSSWWHGSCDPSRPAGRSSSWSPATCSTAGGASTSTTAATASSSPR